MRVKNRCVLAAVWIAAILSSGRWYKSVLSTVIHAPIAATARASLLRGDLLVALFMFAARSCPG